MRLIVTAVNQRMKYKAGGGAVYPAPVYAAGNLYARFPLGAARKDIMTKFATLSTSFSGKRIPKTSGRAGSLPRMPISPFAKIRQRRISGENHYSIPAPSQSPSPRQQRGREEQQAYEKSHTQSSETAPLSPFPSGSWHESALRCKRRLPAKDKALVKQLFQLGIVWRIVMQLSPQEVDDYPGNAVRIGVIAVRPEGIHELGVRVMKPFVPHGRSERPMCPGESIFRDGFQLFQLCR